MILSFDMDYFDIVHIYNRKSEELKNGHDTRSILNAYRVM